jgi:ceramide glucosyltransferase
VIWLPIAICAVAALYQLVAIAACIHHALAAKPSLQRYPPVSILKPIRGISADIYRAIQTHLGQDYPDFELLLGVREDEAGSLAVDNPHVRLITCRTVTPNRKVGSLIDLGRAARHEVIIVNDADIAVPPGYLRDVVAELRQPNTGLVTCIYHALSSTGPGRFEALGVATDFAPSTLVAPFVGVSEFGLGSTLAFCRADLERIGGFHAVADYLADDYQLGCKIHSLGMRNRVAKPVVTTTLAPSNWAAAWRHQVRWSRTVRLSRTAGYAGLPVTFATLWAVVAALCGLPWIAVGLLGLRMTMAVTAGYFILRSNDVLRLFWLIPFRDFYAVAVWAAALFGNTVEWGGEILQLDRNGRIRVRTHESLKNKRRDSERQAG